MRLHGSMIAGVLLLTAGCGSGESSDGGLDASARDGSGLDGSQEAEAGEGSDVAADAASDGHVIVPGPCVEGMVCAASGSIGGMPPEIETFQCECRGGSWTCDRPPTTNGLCISGGPYSLPTGDPIPDAACEGRDLACSVPGRCGELCTCFDQARSTQHWTCGVAPGASPEGGAAPEAGCPWSPISAFPPSGACAPGAKAFTVDCLSYTCVCDSNGTWVCSGSPWFDHCACYFMT